MKIRTDFVTNSSSSSFIAFNIKSGKMIEALEEIGYQFELKQEDAITNTDTIITPAGEEIVPDRALYDNEIWLVKFDSDETVFEWFLTMFSGIDAFYESCEDGEDEADKIKSIEKSIKECEIVGGEAIADGDGSFCMHITVKNGKKTVAVLDEDKWDSHNDTCLGCAIEVEEDFARLADEYGNVKSEEL